jgi:HSP20 family protein
VTIEGKREIPAEENGASHHRRERAEGLFSRVVTLPAEVDGDRVDAEYRDGILRLRLPKTESAKPRQIKVRT